VLSVCCGERKYRKRVCGSAAQREPMYGHSSRCGSHDQAAAFRGASPAFPVSAHQPAFGPVRIANELRKRGLTASGAGAPNLRRPTALLMSKLGAYLKLDGNGAWWCDPQDYSGFG
jgi:hypothetical protein